MPLVDSTFLVNAKKILKWEEYEFFYYQYICLKESKHYGRAGMTMLAMVCVFLKGKLSIF